MPASAQEQTHAVRRELEAICGPRWVSSTDADRRVYARDMWPRLLLEQGEGHRLARLPHLVVWPASTREVAQVIKVALAAGVPIIPYGGGSGVCGGVVPVNGGITVDVKRMDRVHRIDDDELIVSADAGINGERLERSLARRGFTLGHFPSSIYCSTLGGWLATRAAGQLSTKYGKIEDRVLGLTVVTGRGDVIETDGLQRATRGPNWNHLLLGSEGTLGIITSARLRLAPAPQLRVYRGFSFASVPQGTEAIRTLMQAGFRPAVVRLYDDADTFLGSVSLGHKAADAEPGAVVGANADVHAPSSPGERPGLAARLLAAALAHPTLANAAVAGAARLSRGGSCKCIIGFEGAAARTEVEARLGIAHLIAAGAVDRGEGPGLHWLAHRYAVSYKMSPIFVQGAFVDTMEVASTWDRLMPMYHAVTAALRKHALVMAHFSHAYHEGCSIYFTFTARAATREASLARYDAIWRDGIAAAQAAGGTMSHHHGVGLLKSPHLAGEHRQAMAVLGAVKQTFDPAGIMNPGKHDTQASIAALPRPHGEGA